MRTSRENTGLESPCTAASAKVVLPVPWALVAGMPEHFRAMILLATFASLRFGQLTASTIWLVSVTVAGGASSIDMTPAIVGALIALGPLGTGLAYVLNYDIVTRDGATAASVVTYLPPVVSVALDATVLDEPVTVAMVAGMGAILTGVVLVRLSLTRRRSTSPTP